MHALEDRIQQCGAKLGVVTVPADAAQAVIDRMAAAGIRVIWNFAPIRPQIPTGVRVLNEHLAESVGRLSRYLDESEMKFV
jgi:redox-sensing transcriptional repressor